MSRRNDIDALRVLAFGLLILYHVGMLYVAPVQDWRFVLKSSHLSEWLRWPMLVSNLWRMDLLFLISGIATRWLRERSGLLRLAWQRSVRLMLPLLFGMAVVVPIQPYVDAVSDGRYALGFWAFLLHYWHGGPWAPGTFSGWQYGVTWSHLWYLPYVWSYTLVLLAVLPLFESRWARACWQRLPRLRGGWLLGLPVLPLLIWHIVLMHRYPISMAWFGDWFAHAQYGTVFVYGYLLGGASGVWSELARLRRASFWLSAGSFFLYAAFDRNWFGLELARLPFALGVPLFVIAHATYVVYLWAVLATLLGYARVYLDRPFRWLPYAREAVFPWYVLHQSVMLWLAWLLLPLRLGPVLEPLLIIAGTVLGCALLHEGLIRRSRWLRPLFGLKARRRVGNNPEKGAVSHGALAPTSIK